MIEVIIPALNEETTIYHIVASCLRAPSISVVHVMVDAKTTDGTAGAALSAGAVVNRFHGVSGKGQLISYVAQVVQSPRIMLCDGDYTRFSPHIAEIATAIHHSNDTMRIIVPRPPTPAQWKAGGAPFPFNPGAWGVNSGLRSFPKFLLDNIELHGYLTETQLNREAGSRGVIIEQLYEPSFIQPLRFSQRRLEAMEEDRAWGVANGILNG
jgi:hypothetical protein